MMLLSMGARLETAAGTMTTSGIGRKLEEQGIWADGAALTALESWGGDQCAVLPAPSGNSTE